MSLFRKRKFVDPPMVPVPEIRAEKGIYYIEFVKPGKRSRVRTGTFKSAYLAEFTTKLLAAGYAILYMERFSDGAVIWARSPGRMMSLNPPTQSAVR